ncbi:hypothetical protein ACOSQ2_005397 [Xanthoceras sorbifolium]
MLCKHSLDNFLLLATVLWKNWCNCNCALHDRPSVAVCEVVPWCKSFLAEFGEANSNHHLAGLSRFLRWIPPILGGFKLNTDAALDFKKARTGLGAVVRDHLSRVVLSGMTSFAGLLSPAVAEAKAILFGLLMAFEGGFPKLLLNSYSITVINVLNGSNLLFSELGLMVEDIHHLVHRFKGEVSFSHSPCLTNRVAHSLAKLALIDFCDDCHPSIRYLILEDLSLLL